MSDGAEILIAAMDKRGITDNDLRDGLAAICGGESGMRPIRERGYASTSNARIREIFASARHLSDDELTRVKKNDKDFFEAMYGVGTSTGLNLGNTQPGDGYKFRGGWQIQLTGRANYTRYLRMVGRPDLIENPDAAIEDAALGADLAVAYILDRYHGGGFEAMKRAVGNSFGYPDDVKNRLYAEFCRSGRFHAGNHVTPAVSMLLQKSDRGDAVKATQDALIVAGFFCGPWGADGIFGNATEDAVANFQSAKGLRVTRVIDDPTRAALGL